jgi:hypothetical protein
MYEHRTEPLASPATFYGRIFKNILVAILIMTFFLLIGTAGYHYTAGLIWIDALHNAAMIMSGMGLVDKVSSDGGKIFSSIYALFSGVLFITNIGVILAPALHRIYHRMHLED